MKTDIMSGRYTEVCLAVVMTLALIQSAAAYTCYDCYTVLNQGSNNCMVVSNNTAVKQCTDGCSAIISNIVKSVTRGCGTSNTGCLGWGDLKVCTFSCTSDRCNIQSAAQPLTSSATLLLSLAVMAVLSKLI